MNFIVSIIVLLILLFVVRLLFRLFGKLAFFLGIILLAATLFVTWKILDENYSLSDRLRSFANSPIMSTALLVEDVLNVPIIPIEDEILIDAPLVKQLPELPRGCEVTSLAMLLQDAGVHVDKMTLAKEVKKNPAEMETIDGQIHYGHPNDGFIGDMYTKANPGLGVYHSPIQELADSYLPGKILDLTGGDFKQIKIQLSDNRPVWVIINTAYQKLDPSYFQTWQTPSGKVSITYKEHSVLVTGYDKEYIYFNDPLTGSKNRKAPAADFEKAWVQMGKQAITYMN